MKLSEEVERERYRCDALCADLEGRWRRAAERIRAEGTWNTGWPFYRTFVAKKWEQAARDMESAADGLAVIRRIIQSGARCP